MKTEKELLKIVMERDDWKHLELWVLANAYEKKATERSDIFPPVADDRRVFINVYRQLYEAIDSLPDNPNNVVCVAMNHYISEEREMMDEILNRFCTKGGTGMTWIITGPNLPDLRIRADSFDEAMAKARLRNQNYCGGYVG